MANTKSTDQGEKPMLLCGAPVKLYEAVVSAMVLKIGYEIDDEQILQVDTFLKTMYEKLPTYILSRARAQALKELEYKLTIHPKCDGCGGDGRYWTTNHSVDINSDMLFCTKKCCVQWCYENDPHSLDTTLLRSRFL